MLFGLLESAEEENGLFMAENRIIKRYAGYYSGWCVAFGEHKAAYDEEKRINWLYGESKIGLTLSPDLKRHFLRELLGKHSPLPKIVITKDTVFINDFVYPLENDDDYQGFQRLSEFFLKTPEPHMYLTSHFCYPKGTRIITFGDNKPLIVIYKEIEPLQLVLE